jgi:hypothetical protein
MGFKVRLKTEDVGVRKVDVELKTEDVGFNKMPLTSDDSSSVVKGRKVHVGGSSILNSTTETWRPSQGVSFYVEGGGVVVFEGELWYEGMMHYIEGEEDEGGRFIYWGDKGEREGREEKEEEEEEEEVRVSITLRHKLRGK